MTDEHKKWLLYAGLAFIGLLFSLWLKARAAGSSGGDPAFSGVVLGGAPVGTGQTTFGDFGNLGQVGESGTSGSGHTGGGASHGEGKGSGGSSHTDPITHIPDAVANLFGLSGNAGVYGPNGTNVSSNGILKTPGLGPGSSLKVQPV